MSFRLAAAAVVLLQIPVAQSLDGSDPAWARYLNPRFHYGVSYPAAVLTPQGESENADGQSFASEARHAEMSAWGSFNAMDETIRSRFRDRSRSHTEEEPDRRVTYRRVAGDWFVVSGFRGGRIFYEKTSLKGNVFISVELSYPAEDKGYWDSIVTAVSRSLRHTSPDSPA